MLNINDQNLMTSVQVKRQLKSINTDKPDTKNNLLELVEKFKCMDQIVKSTGLVKDGFSFVNRVSWDTVLSDLKNDNNTTNDVLVNDVAKTVSQASSQLEDELIPQLRKMRNKWMYEVILIEFVFFGLISLAVASVTHMQGLWDFSSISIGPFLYERPVFSLLIGVFTFLSFVTIHFITRKFVATRLVKNVNNTSSEFDFAQAFLKNTRIQHSIFRPDIVGWGWLEKRCMNKE